MLLFFFVYSCQVSKRKREDLMTLLEDFVDSFHASKMRSEGGYARLRRGWGEWVTEGGWVRV